MPLTFTADTDEAVAAERRRQIEDKGYTAEHDDAHTLRELAACADERLAQLIYAFGQVPEHMSGETQMLVEVRAVLLATIESAERRLATWERVARGGVPDDAYPFAALRDTGLLWAVNRYVLHPRGFALALHYEDDAATTPPLGWSVLGDGSETWHFTPADDDDRMAAFESFLDTLRSRPIAETAPADEQASS